MQITVVVSHPPQSERRLVFDKAEVTIGRVQGNDVVLPYGNVSRHHARFVAKDGKFILVDLRSTNGTFVNGRRITSPCVIDEHDLVQIGEFRIAFEDEEGPTTEWKPAPALDPVEERLIAAIAARDHASRSVYADWLEERGDNARAEYLRLQELLLAEPEDRPELQPLRDRLRQLAGGLDLDWRREVGRPVLEGCLVQEVPCPKDWGELAPTARDNMRMCESCSQPVIYVTTTEELVARARDGLCMAIDPAVLRSPDDIHAARRSMMGGFIPAPRPRRL